MGWSDYRGGMGWSGYRGGLHGRTTRYTLWLHVYIDLRFIIHEVCITWVDVNNLRIIVRTGENQTSIYLPPRNFLIVVDTV